MIQFYNKEKKKLEIEKVYGEQFVSFLYENKLGSLLTQKFFVHKKLSRLMGAYYSSRYSKKKIQSFIRQYNIEMNEFEECNYGSFNDFFIRKFKPNKRVFDLDETILSAPCEARYFGYSELNTDCKYPVKGESLSPDAILNKKNRAALFKGGVLVIARLCPVDYHRFHFPCDGVIEENYKIPGILHSVNPTALKTHSEIFSVNEREVTLIHSPVFGKIAYVEVGAMGVGKIIQTRNNEKKSLIKKGEEKGYFLFGASTVILFLEKNSCVLDSEISSFTQKGIETYMKLGKNIAASSR